MAKKTTNKTSAKNAPANTNTTKPKRNNQQEVKPKETKPMKVKMIHTYISNTFILFTDKEYEIPADLAKALVKKGEAKKC